MSILTDIFEVMQNSTDLDDRWRKIGAFMANHGADQVNYAVLNTLNQHRDIAPVTQFSTMSSQWIDYYLERELFLHDPHVEYVRKGGLAPYRWSRQSYHRLTDEGQRNVIDLATEAGLHAQISVVAPNPFGAAKPIGGMTIGSSLEGHHFFPAISGKELILQSAAMLFHHFSIGEIQRQSVGAQPLSTRERDCMSFVAMGLRTSRIAERICVSDVTVEMHLRNARRKLGASTTAQAVARAMIFGDVAL